MLRLKQNKQYRKQQDIHTTPFKEHMEEKKDLTSIQPEKTSLTTSNCNLVINEIG